MDFEIVNEKAVSIYITEFKSISPNSNANLSPSNSQTPSVLNSIQKLIEQTINSFKFAEFLKAQFC